MKIFIQPCDAENRIDGTIKHHILDHLPSVVTSLAQADLVIVPVSLLSDFRINPDLLRINKKVCLIDFLEYGLGWDQKTTHLLGRTPDAITCLKEPDWKLLDDFFAARPPALYLKRELLEAQREERVQPVEWPCYLPLHPIQSEVEFNARPMEVFNVWGYSNASRPLLHSRIFAAMATHSLGVISAWDHYPRYFESPCHRTWVSLYSPHFVRRPIAEMLWWHMRSKLLVSLPGAGQKCFRSSEHIDIIPALQEDAHAWTFPWVHNQNCIRLRPGFEFEDLWENSSRSDLYPIYVESQRTLERYSTANYVAYLVRLMENSV